MIKRFLNKIRNKFYLTSKDNVKKIKISNILRGAEGDELSGLQYVSMTGDIFRTSTRVIDGPQAQLLKDYMEYGDEIFNPSKFVDTFYYKNAFESICYVGDYFPAASRPEDIIKVARRFVDSFLEKDISQYEQKGHNRYDENIIVRPISNSNCFQLVSGNHRVASAHIKGIEYLDAVVLENRVTQTYFTDLINKVLWDEGEALYQPIELPEFSNLPLIRKSTDRVKKMFSYLDSNSESLNNLSLLDIGSYYGWFVNEFRKKGVDAYGLERDFAACKVSMELYGIPKDKFFNIPLEHYLLNDNNNQKYDIVLFLSVLHHFSMGKSFLSDIEVLKKLAEKTNKYMFFDTGEEHEVMFGEDLKGWNQKSITDFVLKHTDFKEVIHLGRDSDNLGKHTNDYKRMLFVFKK